MSDKKKKVWRRIGNIIITVLTALFTSVTAQSCIS